MKTLLILRGLDTQSSTRKNWIKEEGIEKYVISIDSIKKMYGSIEDTEKYGPKITRMDSRDISYKFLETLDNKMRKGCLVIVDSENLKNKELKKLEAFADVYKYRIFQKVFPITHTDILEWRNRIVNIKTDYPFCPKSKEELLKDVEQYFNSFISGPIYNYPEINKMSDLDSFFEKEEITKNYTIEVNKNTEIVHVGDVHGAYDLIKDLEPKENQVLVFHGDYIDRGTSPKKCLDRVFELKRKYPNKVFLIEGNHEMHLRRFCGLHKYPKLAEEGFFRNLCNDFSNTTMKDYSTTTDNLIRVLRDMNHYLQEYIIIKRGNQTFICTHGGLRNISQLWFYLVGNLTYGNRDMENYDRSFSNKIFKKRSKTVYSIHGHCKYSNYNNHMFPGVVNLDPDEDNMVVIFKNKPHIEDEKINENIEIRKGN